jgi:endonuclease/exonuclease/phosphatase (EEP) superfamily protein YafD
MLLASSTITACITNEYSEHLAYRDVTAVATEPESCASNLSGNGQTQHQELNSSDIRMINWNIQKGGNPEWVTDLMTLAGEPDLMIFQEAAVDSDVWEFVADEHYRSFAPGYRGWRSLTGVMTLSTAAPIVQCNLMSVEPWLGSAKATLITEYGLTDTDQTLLVVNVHAINFTFGMIDFEEQIGRALAPLTEHSGPILLSGDFNTWHAGRAETLKQMVDTLGLVALDYGEDHRKTAFGLPLDHIYVRGLRATEVKTSRVDTSDHNPMSVKLRIDGDAAFHAASSADGRFGLGAEGS